MMNRTEIANKLNEINEMYYSLHRKAEQLTDLLSRMTKEADGSLSDEASERLCDVAEEADRITDDLLSITTMIEEIKPCKGGEWDRTECTYLIGNKYDCCEDCPFYHKEDDEEDDDEE